MLLEAAQHEDVQEAVSFLEADAGELVLGDIERLVKHPRRREDPGVEQIEERPQLGEVVLERRAGEQERARKVHLAHGGRDLCVRVLEDVPLVEHKEAPVDLLDQRRAERGGLHHLIRRHYHVVRADLVRDARLETLALRDVRRMELDHAQHRAPALELGAPRGEHRERADDERCAGQLQGELEVGNQGDGLERLAKPHLVAEDR